MSVYLDGDSVLLESGKVATSADCCCECECCPEVDFTISGEVNFSASHEFDPGFLYEFSGDLPFEGFVSFNAPGSYLGGANTDCQCTAEPDCDPILNCPDNFGPDCPFAQCTPPDPDPPERLCQQLPITVNLKCFANSDVVPEGWYLQTGYASATFCGGSFTFQTDEAFVNDVPGFIQITETCSVGPEGTYDVTLDTDPSGTASIHLVIDPPTGACCSSYGVCDDDVTEDDCLGTWLCPGSTCDDDANGACCIAGVCSDGVDEAFCNFLGGTYFGDCTDCAHETCP